MFNGSRSLSGGGIKVTKSRTGMSPQAVIRRSPPPGTSRRKFNDGREGAPNSSFNRRQVLHDTSKSLSGKGFGSTKSRLGLTPRAMIRRGATKERGLDKKSSRVENMRKKSTPRPTTSHWTLINGALERASFIGRRHDKWKRRGYTDPTAVATLNVHGNEDSYFCGFPGQGVRLKTNQKKAIIYRKPITRIIKACLMGDWDGVLALLKETPERAKQHTDDNAFPLHLCLARLAPEEVISTLIEIFPEAAKQPTKKKRSLPLHIACEASNPERIVLIVGDAYPKAAKKRLRSRYELALPLHLALARGMPPKEGQEDDDNFRQRPLDHEDWGAILAVLKMFRGAAKKRFRSKEMVEWAAWLGAPAAVRRAIWKASKSDEIIVALRGHVWGCVIDMLKDEKNGEEHAKHERTPMNQFPLHVAVEERAPVEAVRLLVALYKKAVGRRAKFSMWVLGTKTRKGRWRAPMSLLVGAHELLVHEHMPIHTAALIGAPPNVIELLAEAGPEAVQTRARGLLPIHIALLHGYKNGRTVSAGTIKALLKAFPEAIRLRTEDTSGNSRLPLHLATISDAPPEVIEVLLKAYPGAVDEPDAWGHRPIHYGLSYHSSMRVVQTLLLHDGHHKDHSVRTIAKDLVPNSSNDVSIDKPMSNAQSAEKVSNHHKDQYWNRHWNHRSRMISKKRWGKDFNAGAKCRGGSMVEQGEAEGKHDPTVLSESDTSSSSSGGSSGSSSSGSGSSSDSEGSLSSDASYD